MKRARSLEQRVGNTTHPKGINFTIKTDSHRVFTAISPRGSPLSSPRRAIIEAPTKKTGNRWVELLGV